MSELNHDRIRPPAVAGHFYPDEPRELAVTVENLLAPQPIDIFRAFAPTSSASSYSVQRTESLFKELQRQAPGRFAPLWAPWQSIPTQFRL